ncbi:hypothetical protein HELRODRAFT_170169 [Helobdella robusta]|uniref:Uncharacterized protein n=1 Tax=Helobdella robusta TaxID=6412 RepID=T1F2Q7_HELRO|nr:hypothetical protein HELRODRAFT_170169 [Helobdella robusta]ESO07624.1 hypothetical protein HELRODRAFT_170169 [Helobdella robusta]
MNFENRWVLRSALNFASDGEIVREVGREFPRKGPEKAKADLAKECLTRVKKKREEEDDRKPGRLENSLSKLEGSRSREQVVDDIELIILVSSKRFIGVNTEKDSVRCSCCHEVIGARVRAGDVLMLAPVLIRALVVKWRMNPRPVFTGPVSQSVGFRTTLACFHWAVESGWLPHNQHKTTRVRTTLETNCVTLVTMPMSIESRIKSLKYQNRHRLFEAA